MGRQTKGERMTELGWRGGRLNPVPFAGAP